MQRVNATLVVRDPSTRYGIHHTPYNRHGSSVDGRHALQERSELEGSFVMDINGHR